MDGFSVSSDWRTNGISTCRSQSHTCRIITSIMKNTTRRNLFGSGAGTANVESALTALLITGLGANMNASTSLQTFDVVLMHGSLFQEKAWLWRNKRTQMTTLTLISTKCSRSATYNADAFASCERALMNILLYCRKNTSGCAKYDTHILSQLDRIS